jgi:hypothetical protein
VTINANTDWKIYDSTETDRELLTWLGATVSKLSLLNAKMILLEDALREA